MPPTPDLTDRDVALVWAHVFHRAHVEAHKSNVERADARAFLASERAEWILTGFGLSPRRARAALDAALAAPPEPDDP